MPKSHQYIQLVMAGIQFGVADLLRVTCGGFGYYQLLPVLIGIFWILEVCYASRSRLP